MDELPLMATPLERVLTGDLRIIGLGTCGTVFEQTCNSNGIAVKKGRDIKAMWNDFRLTNIVHNAFKDTRELLQGAFPTTQLTRVPRCYSFNLPSHTLYWDVHLAKFPPSHRKVGAVFHADRIPPITRDRWMGIVDRYFEEDMQEEAKRNEENDDCLIRVYLGENETGTECYDSTRNFPMRLNMVEDFGEDKERLAKQMAVALAVIHWQAQVDAMDAEFVLGSASPLLRSPRAFCPSPKCEPYNVDEDQMHGVQLSDIDGASPEPQPNQLWVLDFDKSSPIELKKRDVYKRLIPAFLGNDPYYPRPDVDPGLWATFSDAYLKASEIVLRNKGVSPQALKLPKVFINTVTAKIKEQENWNAEEQITFE
ncbi:MAG: hypothetical protein Q9222_002731 [Ikaeria aurantiellina]